MWEHEGGQKERGWINHINVWVVTVNKCKRLGGKKKHIKLVYRLMVWMYDNFQTAGYNALHGSGQQFIVYEGETDRAL